MRYISIFSGIEAASVAWEPLGWEPVAFAEIEEFPSAVLRARYPDVPNLGDITKVDWSAFKEGHGAIDLVVGGSPCQSFSIAGKREGLAGASGLMFEYIRCVQELMPSWFIWENVPGALSSERGGAFLQLLSSMDVLGYGLAWRILDAQFFGVAQRRRRVFLVGHLGDMRACEVLFEPESLRWDTPSSKEKRQALAADARSRAAGAGGGVTAFAQNQRDEVRLMGGDGTVAGTVPAQTWGTHKNETLLAECLTPWDVQSKRVNSPDGVCPTLQSGTHENQSIEPLVMASGQANAEICEGGGGAHPDAAPRGARTSGGADVFPSLCATDGDKQFIDNQSVDGGRLVLDPRREWP